MHYSIPLFLRIQSFFMVAQQQLGSKSAKTDFHARHINKSEPARAADARQRLKTTRKICDATHMRLRVQRCFHPASLWRSLISAAGRLLDDGSHRVTPISCAKIQYISHPLTEIVYTSLVSIAAGIITVINVQCLDECRIFASHLHLFSTYRSFNP